MYELHHLKGNTYYIDGPTNIGLYKLNDVDCVLIDCGTSKEGPIIETLLRRHHLKLRYIVNTHCHADHSGANLYLMKMTGCRIIASKIERAFLRDSKLDIGFLNGGYPLKEFDTPLMHINEQKEIYSLEHLPKDLRSFKLPGHHYGMIGIRTSDGVNFIADTLGSKELIEHQHILLIYDVKGYLKSLDYIASLNGEILVPSHSYVTSDILELVDFNRRKIQEIIDIVLHILQAPQTVEEIVARVFEHYGLRISYNKYLLISSTIRSYISYLDNEKRVESFFKDNKLFFIKTKSLTNL